MKRGASKPSSVLSLGEIVYFLQEEVVDNDNKLIRTTWYDPKGIRVVSVVLDGNKVVVNRKDIVESIMSKGEIEGDHKIFEMSFDINKESIYTDKDSAIEDAWDLNEKSLEQNRYAVSEKKKELSDLEEKVKMVKVQIDAGNKVSQFLEDWLEKLGDGETYTDDQAV